MSASAEQVWDLHPRAGWDEYQASRARFLARLGMQARLHQLERAWLAPARELPSSAALQTTPGRAGTG